jgi:hypothetical protein
MRKTFYFLLATCFLISLVSCSSEDCVTCTLAGLGETVCEEELDVYNALNGTNFTSLDQYVGTIEGLGGSCN